MGESQTEFAHLVFSIIKENFNSMTSALEIKNLHASVADQQILNGIDLLIKPGETMR